MEPNPEPQVAKRSQLAEATHPIVRLRRLRIVNLGVVNPVLRLRISRVINLLRWVHRGLHVVQQGSLGLGLQVDEVLVGVVRVYDESEECGLHTDRGERRVFSVLLLDGVGDRVLVLEDEVDLCEALHIQRAPASAA